MCKQHPHPCPGLCLPRASMDYAGWKHPHTCLLPHRGSQCAGSPSAGPSRMQGPSDRPSVAICICRVCSPSCAAPLPPDLARQAGEQLKALCSANRCHPHLRMCLCLPRTSLSCRRNALPLRGRSEWRVSSLTLAAIAAGRTTIVTSSPCVVSAMTARRRALARLRRLQQE